MLIITGEDKRALISHLNVLKMFYRSQIKAYDGTKLGDAHAFAFRHLNELLTRMEAEQNETH